MALLPNPEEQQRVAPRANRGVASYAPGNEGQALQNEGDKILELAHAETQRLDELKAEGAETELMRAELELGNEYEAVKGDGVMQLDYHSTYKDRYKAKVAEISGTLATPAQKARFQQQADRRSVAFDARRISYAMGEAEKIQGVNYQARQQVLDDTARNSYQRPEVVAKALADKNDAFAKEMIRKGIADPATLTALHTEMEAGFYGAIIQHSLNNDDMETANAYFAGSKKKMSEEQQKHFKDQLDVGNNYNAAQDVADKALEMSGKGASLEDVELYVRKNTSNVEQNRLAHDFLNQATKAREEAIQQKVGGLVYNFVNSGGSTKQMLEVKKSPEYRQMAPLERLKVDEAMRHEVDYRLAKSWQQESQNHTRAEWARASAAAKREAGFNSKETMRVVYGMMENGRLKSLTPEQIYSFSDEIGIANVNALLTAKKNMTPEYKGAKQIDSDIVNGALQHFNLNKEDGIAAKGYIAVATSAWAEAHPGEQPTVAQQNAIINSAMSKFNTPATDIIGLFSRGDTTNTLYENIPDDRPRAKAKQATLRHYAAIGVEPPTGDKLEYATKVMEAINSDPLSKNLTTREKQRILEGNLENDYKPKVKLAKPTLTR